MHAHISYAVCGIVQLWEEDELLPDKSSPSSEDAGDHIADIGAGDDDTVPDDGTEEPSNCIAPESEGREVENGDTDMHAHMEDTSEQVADESESNKQECLISFDDDEGLGGQTEDEDAAECGVEKCEDDIPSDSPTHDMADVNAEVSYDGVGIQESSTGEM